MELNIVVYSIYALGQITMLLVEHTHVSKTPEAHY